MKTKNTQNRLYTDAKVSMIGKRIDDLYKTMVKYARIEHPEREAFERDIWGIMMQLVNATHR